MAKFEITSPSGKVLEIEGDTPPSEAELDEIFKSVDSGASQPQTKKGIDLTPSGLYKQALSYPMAGIRSLATGEDFNTTRQNALQAVENFKPAGGAGDFIVDTAVYSRLPMLKGFKGANALTGAYQGGLIGGLEGLKEGVNPLQSGGAGAGWGAGINMALPPAIKAGGAVASKLLPNSIPWLKPETVRQAIKPNSQALDLNENTAQNLLMNTTENVRNAYKNLLEKKGNDVGVLLNELPENVEFKAGDILQDYDKIFNNYSLSNNPELNPAINATTREMNRIEDMLYSNGEKNINEFKNNLEGLRYEKMPLETIKGKNKGQFYTRSLDSMQNNIELANRRFNADILDRIKANPELLNNPQAIQHFESVIQDMNNKVPDELIEEMYGKLYQVIGDSEKLNKANYTVSPKELYDINKNISDMTDWGAVDAATKNDVLEQMYGANAERIGNLSPELQKANKVYSDLMDFKKNEGIDRILNNREKIDTASSALKNYNSTITKGNTNRNIQDLENILVKEGYEPFLNKIDDVNAAQDLLNTPVTGFNPFGLTNLLKRGTTAGLKVVRDLNRNPNRFAGLSDNVRKLLTIGGGKGAPMLYGGISYNDDDLYNAQ